MLVRRCFSTRSQLFAVYRILACRNYAKLKVSQMVRVRGLLLRRVTICDVFSYCRNIGR